MTSRIVSPATLPMLAAVLALLAPGTVLADAVYMKNGDRISGKVLHMDGDKVKLETPYAGEIEIETGEIDSLETDAEVDVQLDDGTLGKARLERSAKGSVTLHRAGGAPAATVPLERVAYLNPVAKESGVGVDWSGRANLGLTDTSGNSETRDAYVEAELRATAKEWRWTTNGRAKYAESSGRQTTGSWLAGTRYDWFFAERQYLYARASAQRDTFAGIDLRWTVGGGYGYQIFESDRTNFELRAGLDYVDTTNTVPPDQQYLAIGWGVTFDYWIVEDRLQFFHNSEGFADPRGDEGLVLRAETGLRAPIVDDLSANFQVNLDYNSDPAPGFKSTDRTYIVGIGYTF